VGTVERIDETATIGGRRPPARPNGAAGSQRELGETALPPRRVPAAPAREPPPNAAPAGVVEPLIGHAPVRQVGGHAPDGTTAADLEKARVAGGVELQKRGTELKALRPLGPPARLIPALHGEDRRAILRTPGLFNREDLAPRELEEACNLRQQIARRARA